MVQLSRKLLHLLENFVSVDIPQDQLKDSYGMTVLVLSNLKFMMELTGTWWSKKNLTEHDSLLGDQDRDTTAYPYSGPDGACRTNI